MTQSNLTTSMKFALGLYVICFVSVSISHTFDILHHGIIAYRKIPLVLNFYFVCIALMSLVTACLFFMRPILALTIAALIMASNFLVDLCCGSATNLPSVFGFQLLKSFRFFVFISAPYIISRLKMPTTETVESSDLVHE